MLQKTCAVLGFAYWVWGVGAIPGLTRGSARSTVNCEQANRSMFCAETDWPKRAPAARAFQNMAMSLRKAKENVKSECDDAQSGHAAGFLNQISSEPSSCSRLRRAGLGTVPDDHGHLRDCRLHTMILLCNSGGPTKTLYSEFVGGLMK
jgi:hypothetical protein